MAHIMAYDDQNELENGSRHATLLDPVCGMARHAASSVPYRAESCP